MTNENILLLSRQIRDKVETGIALAATQISGEDPTAPIINLTVTQAAKRHALATSVLNNTQQYAKRFALPCAAQQGLNDEYDSNLNYIGTNEDNAINFTINSIWDDMSGVSFLDLNPMP